VAAPLALDRRRVGEPLGTGRPLVRTRAGEVTVITLVGLLFATLNRIDRHSAARAAAHHRDRSAAAGA
jgi:hypothetical protein